MRILVAHNRYRSHLPSGENRVVDDEVAMLREAGLEVETFFRESDDIEQFTRAQKLALAVKPIYSHEAVKACERKLDELRPDVVHLHNPFPLISPWIVRTAKRRGIAVVQTVHNYRHSCPAGVFFRDGQICEECSGKAFPSPAIRHGCYRGSRAQSAVMATAALVHRSTWQMVDRFLPVSEFVAEHLVKAGIPREKITVKPNAVPDPGPPPPLGEGFLFAARLDPEKGVKLLLDAWELSGLGEKTRLVIAGDGPLRPLVEQKAKELPGITYVGQVDRDRVKQLMADTAVVVVPSLCYEAFGLAVAEAFSMGRPVVATAVGSLATVIDDEVGWTCDPLPTALARSLTAAASGPAARSSAARCRYCERVTPRIVLDQLLAVYRQLGAGAAAASPTTG